jgi:queuine tRNA-ribosyltransferase
MPVGTHANVRSQRFETLRALNYPVLLANTYHLMLRPGPEVFERLGGIQKFMGWGKSVLTDSGGFQIFSLAKERQMSEAGALFKSYVDNRPVLLTPERSIEVQKAIGSDIMMVLDQCISSTADRSEALAAMHLTHRWAKRSLRARGDSAQSIFAIVQGALFSDLRKVSADVLTQVAEGGVGFDGFAIGGLAVGETKSEREDMTALTAELLPRHLPRYLMGVGTPLDILEAVHRGIDMFDCILPGALGQQGVAFTGRGKLDLRRGAYKFVDKPLDAHCPCTACREHSIAYLHHLIRTKQVLGGILLTEHNLTFYAKLMQEIRQNIVENTFQSFYRRQKEALSASDRNFPVLVPKPRKPRTANQLGEYQLHQTPNNIFTIRHIPSGEVMHSTNDPRVEAQALYIEQSRFALRAAEDTLKPLVLWDVGLGAATNAMAVIASYEKQLATRPVHLISFENDLNALRLALKHASCFTHLWHAAPGTVLEKKEWRSKTGSLQWTLLQGDFVSTMDHAPVPDLIFFDLFSPKTNPTGWTLDTFQRLFRCCQSHCTELFTYSSSTAVRAALFAAGFYVAEGAATGPKQQTTIALTPAAAVNTRHTLLAKPWLHRWQRSQAQFPMGIPVELRTQFESTILAHPQFIST